MLSIFCDPYPILFFFLSSASASNLNYRYCLWILGNATTLSNSGSIWADLVRNAKDRRCFFNASSDKTISHVIAKQKSDLCRAEAKKSTPLARSRNNRVWVLSCRTFSTAASDRSKQEGEGGQPWRRQEVGRRRLAAGWGRGGRKPSLIPC